MSQLNKLLIQGLRSFGPTDEDGAVMNFVHKERVDNGDGGRNTGGRQEETRAWPLTLILGQNGCGKTTIIECLRYVTTGDHPPGSYSGKSFVHDPKMAGEMSVKAQVKLAFQGVDKQRYVVLRCLEATQKAKTITIKTLDGQFLKFNDDNKPVSISSKCIDVLTKMGVSKPILNYVIFCHQEDSNWPLDEGSKVKAKFDEIFASDKYQHCLKTIKEVARKHREDQSGLKKDLEYLSGDKKVVVQKRKELMEKNASIDALKDQIAEAEEELKPLKQQLETAREIEKNYSHTIELRSEVKTKLEMKLEEASKVEQSLDYENVDTTSMDELDRTLKTLKADTELIRKQLPLGDQELTRVKHDLDENREKEKKVNVAIGQCISEMQENEKRKKNLRDKVSEQAWDDISGFQVNSSDSTQVAAMDTILERIAKDIREADNEFNHVNQEMETMLEEKNREINDLETSRAIKENDKRTKTKELVDSKREIAQLRLKLREAQNSQEKLEELSKAYESKQEQLAKLKESVNLDELRSTVMKRKQDLKELEIKEKALKEEKALLDANQRVLSDIQLKEEDLKSKKQQMEKLLNKTFMPLSNLFGGSPPKPSVLMDHFIRAKDFNSQKRESLQQERSKAEHSLASFREKRNEVKKAGAEKNQSVEAFDEEVKEALEEAEDIDEEMERIKAKIAEEREELARKEANKYTYQGFIDKLDAMLKTTGQTSACPTCNRAFHEDAEARELQAELRTHVSQIPLRVKAIKAQLERSTRKQEKLSELLSRRLHVDGVRKEARTLKEQATKLDQEIRNLTRSLTSNDEELKSCEPKLVVCDDIYQDVVVIDNLQKEIADVEDKLSDLKAGNEGLEATRSLEEFKREDDETSRKLTAARLEIEAKQNREIDVEKRLNALEKDLNAMQSTMLETKRQHQESTTWKAKMEELQTLAEELQAATERVAKELEDIDDAKKEKRREKREVEKERNAQVKRVRERCDAVRKKEGELKVLVDGIREYQENLNDHRLEGEEQKKKELDEKKQQLDGELKRIVDERTEREKKILDNEKHERQIEEMKKLKKLWEEIEKLKREMKRYDDNLKLLDFDQNKRQRRNLEEKCESIEHKKVDRMGRLSIVKTNVRDLEKELRDPKFRDAEDKYRNKYLENRLKMHVIMDLEKYHKALTYAITTFHKERMKVINRIVRELWRNTYKGNDIDYIEIKTDEMDPNAAMEKRKTCNYRVIMVKNDTELEMRGRCSAGQKVLASLIIRLALAETFSTNCGVIALDEPTTNLDRDNIESLAQALATLVEKRSSHNNFQLIVITHDEDLITMLGRQVPQQRYYYRVSRNERGLSAIRRFAIDTI